jgi:hypothetical protein
VGTRRCHPPAAKTLLSRCRQSAGRTTSETEVSNGRVLVLFQGVFLPSHAARYGLECPRTANAARERSLFERNLEPE